MIASDPPVPDVDYAATSVRPQWSSLPAAVQQAVERAAGGQVVCAEPSAGSGFSGGFAAVLHLEGGRRVFAKAGRSINPHIVVAYRQESQVLAVLTGLGNGVPAPRLVGHAEVTAGVADDYTWQIVVAEAARGRMPLLWTERDLAAVHEACLRVADALTPVPTALAPLVRRMSDEYALHDDIRASIPDLAAGRRPLTRGQPLWLPSRYDDLGALVQRAPAALTGETACHCDLRADNVLVDGDACVFVDWNWVSVGPEWADFVGLLPLARDEGVDVDAWVRRSPLTRDVDPDLIDCWLAVIIAYMLSMADQPLWPGGTPAIREHQRRYARTFADWLAVRRGWE